MAKTQASRSKEYRQRKRDGVTEIGPLDVYSESRWKFLQEQGYVWDESSSATGNAVRKVGNAMVGFAVPVPGDPGYPGLYKNG